MSKSDIHTPLKPAAFQILLALADGPAHGYAAMQAVRERSGGRVRVSTGSFYRHLSTLMRAGFVDEATGPAGDDPRRGAYYRVTPKGRQVLALERDRLAALVAALDALSPSSRRGRP
jgi:DNA-binding PadR family transcriptional regulator